MILIILVVCGQVQKIWVGVSFSFREYLREELPWFIMWDNLDLVGSVWRLIMRGYKLIDFAFIFNECEVFLDFESKFLCWWELKLISFWWLDLLLEMKLFLGWIFFDRFFLLKLGKGLEFLVKI